MIWLGILWDKYLYINICIYKYVYINIFIHSLETSSGMQTVEYGNPTVRKCQRIRSVTDGIASNQQMLLKTDQLWQFQQKTPGN